MRLFGLQTQTAPCGVVLSSLYLSVSALEPISLERKLVEKNIVSVAYN